MNHSAPLPARARPALAWLAAIVAVAGLPRALGAQDSVIVIDPDAPMVDTLQRLGPPADVLQEALLAFNDGDATRLEGDVTLPAGSRWTGRIALYRGDLRVAGEIVGPVVVINGNLRLLEGGVIRGDILVVGGRLVVASGATHEGRARAYWDAAPVVREAGGKLAEREARRSLSELAQAQKTFGSGKFTTAIIVATGGVYNRVEGLPLALAPRFTWRPDRRNTLRLELRGILRTSADPSGTRSLLGYHADVEWRRAGRVGLVAGARAYSVFDAIETQPLAREESGWSALLLQRDYRDWYERQGVDGYVGVLPVRALRIDVSLRREDQRTVRAGDPWSLFRNKEVWRPNPLIDDGTYTMAGLSVAYDTRNDRDAPTSGWWLTAGYEWGTSANVGPVPLPAEIRDAIPIDRRYEFSRIRFDLRRYSRLDASNRINLRLSGAGWVGGDPLPLQQRLSLGGPGDALPGYGFRALRCQPADYVDESTPALCDRAIAVQAEFRHRLGVDWNFHVRDRTRRELDRVIGIRQPDLVFFVDAGDAWLAGDGPGRVPANRLPVLREWAADLGVGLDAGGMGIYMAKALTGNEPLRLSVRLKQRF